MPHPSGQRGAHLQQYLWTDLHAKDQLDYVGYLSGSHVHWFPEHHWHWKCLRYYILLSKTNILLYTRATSFWSKYISKSVLEISLILDALTATGIAVIIVMLVTTCLMVLVIITVWQRSIVFALSFFFVFGSVELLYLSTAFFKVPKGGWVPLALAGVLMAIMYVWYYGTTKKYEFDFQNKVSMRWLLNLGPSLGIVRVPGIGLIYTDLVSGVPAIFSHFVTNLPAFHEVLVFVCRKSAPVPYVHHHERYLVGRIGPKEYHMYRSATDYLTLQF